MFPAGNARITYTPRPGTTPETELRALSAVYKFVLESKKDAERLPSPDAHDATEGSTNDRTASDKYTL